MFERYDLDNIRTLLIIGFTKKELLHLCEDLPDFEPVCSQLTLQTWGTEIVRRLMEYANQNNLIEALLSWAKERNPSVYEKYKPYDLEDLVGDYFSIDTDFSYLSTGLRLDAAVPEQVTVGQVFDLAVAVRQLTSPTLAEDDLKQVKSGAVQISWPEDKPFVQLRIHVKAPECEIWGADSHSFRLYRGQDSPTFYFQLIPREQDKISIIVVVYQQDNWIGSVRIRTIVQEQVVGGVQVQITSHPLYEQYDTYANVRFLHLQRWTNTQKVEALIIIYDRRLQKLKERQAIEGITVDPSVLIEIEDIEAQLEILHEKLKDYDQY